MKYCSLSWISLCREFGDLYLDVGTNNPEIDEAD